MKFYWVIICLFFLTTQQAKSQKIEVGQSNPISIYAGLGLNITQYSPNGTYASSGGKSHTSYLPKASLGMNIYANPDVRQLVFCFDLSVSLNRYESLYDNKILPYIPVVYSFNQIITALSPQVTLNFYNTDKLKVFAGVGASVELNNYTNKVFKAQDGSNFSYGSTPFYFKKFNTRAVFKVGVLLNKNIQMSAGYLPSVGISQYEPFNLSSQTTQIGINYLLGKQN